MHACLSVPWEGITSLEVSSLEVSSIEHFQDAVLGTVEARGCRPVFTPSFVDGATRTAQALVDMQVMFMMYNVFRRFAVSTIAAAFAYERLYRTASLWALEPSTASAADN